MDEARRIEQDIYQKRKVKIPKKIFLIVEISFLKIRNKK